MNITKENQSYFWNSSTQFYKVKDTFWDGTKCEKYLEEMDLEREKIVSDDKLEDACERRETETKTNAVMENYLISSAYRVNNVSSMQSVETQLSGMEATASQEKEDYHEFLKERINEIFVKIQNGDTEPTFQIGKQSFTVREWDEFLAKFDSIEEAIRKLVEEEIEKSKEEAYKRVKTDMRTKETVPVNSPAETVDEEGVDKQPKIDMLTKETIPARFPLQAVNEEGNQMEDLYLIAIDENGIRCSKAGTDEYEWEIVFTDKSQYEKAVAFMGWAGEHMDNFLFSAHENFWEDFLNGNLDEDGFKEFLEGTNNGIPNYGITKGDSMYVDKSKIQWAKYMNHPGAKFYTAQEMAEMLAEKLEKNNMPKLSDPYSEIYKKYHPEYNGEAIFCQYPGGPLYTADEIGNLMYEKAMKVKKS